MLVLLSIFLIMWNGSQVTSLSPSHCRHNNIIEGSSSSSPSTASRRDWLVSTASTSAATIAAANSWMISPEPAIALDAKFPQLAGEYFEPAATNPQAGQFFFPTLTPPFQRRATYKYTLGRNAWAFEQLLTFANVTATIRCNVIQLQSTGGLWVHSPQWPTDEFCFLLDSLGSKVEHVVLPCNAFEHKAPIKSFVERYPDAKVWVSPGQYGPLGSCGTSLKEMSSLGYKVEGILGDSLPPWADEFDIATLYVDLPRNAGPVSEVAFCHRPSKTLVSTDAVIFVPEKAPEILSTYFDSAAMGGPDFWPKSVLQAVFLPLRTDEFGNYPGYEVLVNRLVRAPILRAVVDARAPTAVRNWIEKQSQWEFDRILTSHFASPITATQDDLRASFDYLFQDDIQRLQAPVSRLPRIACRDWELLDSINQFIAKTNLGEKATFDFQRGCIE